MKVAIVHDDLVQWGGAERVLQAICEIFPDAPIYTSVFDSSNEELYKRFSNKKIVTSFLQKIPGWKKLYKPLFPFYPIAFEQFDFSNFDLVISHTTRFAKSVVTKPKTVHVCYCHTPPRFLWNFSGETVPMFAQPLLPKLRLYDQISSRRVDFFLAGSKNAGRRIKKIYRKDSKVVYPFVDLKRFEGIESFDGGYFLVISRLNKYKKVELAVEACRRLGFPLKVIGVGPEMEKLNRLPPFDRTQGRRRFAPRNGIQFLGNLSDEMVVKVLAGCRALIVPGIEDFGITPLEAQALGKPVIAYKAGGVLETVLDNKTGIFFEHQNIDDLTCAIEKLDRITIDPQNCTTYARKFSKENFVKNFKEAINSCL